MRLKSQAVVLFTAFISLLALLSGCAGSGDSVAKNKYCERGYNPMPLEKRDDLKGKIEVKPGAEFKPGAADYAYDASQIYYYDTARDIRLHLTHGKNSNNDLVVGIECAGGKGINLSMAPVQFSLPLVSDILVDADGAINVRYKEYQVDLRVMKGRALLGPEHRKVVTINTTYVKGSPTDSYADLQDVLQLFAQAKKGGKYVLIAHMKTFAKNSKNKTPDVEMRAMTVMSPVSAEDRKKIDSGETTGNTSAETTAPN